MKRVIIIAMLLVLTAGFVSAADELKIAVVNMQDLIDAHPQGKANKEVLRDEQEALEGEKTALLKKLDKLQDEAREIGKDIENMALSQEARAEKKKAFQEKVVDLQKLQRNSQKRLLTRQRELLEQEKRMRERLCDKIGVLVKSYASEHDISLVLDSSAVSIAATKAVVYSDESMDITKDILSMIKKDAASSKKK